MTFIPITAVEEQDHHDESDDIFFISSEDPLDISIGGRSIGNRSIGSSTSSRQQRFIRSGSSRGAGAADQLDVSIGRSIGGSIGKSTSSAHHRQRCAGANRSNGGGDELDASMRSRSRGGRGGSIGNSIGKSTSSWQRRHRMNRTLSTGSQLSETVVVPKTEDINVKYFIDRSREIARGTNTIVRKCVEKSTGNRYAVKSVMKSDKVQYEHMRKEANLLTDLDHPSIVKIYDTYEDDKYLHMVVELCKGGELYDHVMAKQTKKGKGEGQGHFYSEAKAAVIVRKVVDAICYLHEHNIVHRDLKLENILFKSKPSKGKKKGGRNECCASDEDTDVRLIDFGLSRRYNTHHGFGSLKKLTSFVGTKYYVAPEVLTCSYTHAADLWSVGVLAYALLSAKPPFAGRDDQEIYDKIRRCDEDGVLEFPSPEWDHVSEEAKDFVRCLLVKDASERPGAVEIKEHPWLANAYASKKREEEGKGKENVKGGGGTTRGSNASSKSSFFKKAFRFGRKARAE